MKYLKKEESIYFYFIGDFDYMKIQSIKSHVVYLLEDKSYKKIYFDFEDTTFIDSTGIGFILARYRELYKHKRELILCNLSKENKIIFEMSGIFSIIRHQENEVKL